MSTDIETELRAAFELASDSLVPPPDLDVRVRHAARRRRRVLAAALVVAAGAAAGIYLVAATAVAPHGAGPRPSTGHRPWLFTTVSGGDAIAADSSTVYVATGDHPDAALSAYSRATGRLVRRIGIPALPSALRIGPDGSVWLAFYPDQNGGGTGVWRLSPALARRSGINFGTRRYFGAAPFDILVTSADTAVLGTDHGLATLRLPAPGASGQPVMHWRRVRPAVRQGFPVQLFPLAGRVAVLWSTDNGRHAISVIGRPGLAYRSGPGSIAAEASGLWLTTRTPSGTPTGTLTRLNRALQVVTPRAVTVNQALAKPEQVWADGTTVWVLTAGSRSLACFDYRGGQAGHVGVVRTNLSVGELASAGGKVYVVNSIGVASYAVPTTCR